MSQKFKQSIQKLKKYIKDESVRFRWSIAFKFLFTTFISFFLLYCFFFVMLRMNLHFLEGNGLVAYTSFTETFYEYIFEKFSDKIFYIVLIVFLVLFMGFYVASLLVRPFKVIGEYCEQKIDGKNPSYNPDFLADLTLLTHFSEWFFWKNKRL